MGIVFAAVMLLVAYAFETSASAPGLFVRGRLTSTPTEQSEMMAAIGQDVTIVVRDKGVFDSQVAPLIGQDVNFCLTKDE